MVEADERSYRRTSDSLASDWLSVCKILLDFVTSTFCFDVSGDRGLRFVGFSGTSIPFSFAEGKVEPTQQIPCQTDPVEQTFLK